MEWRLIYVLDILLILVLTAPLIEKLTVISMRHRVVFTKRYIRSIIPCRRLLILWFASTVLESMHLLFLSYNLFLFYYNLSFG